MIASKPVFNLIILITVVLFSAFNKKNKNPNIIIILADDLDYGDPQVYNSESKIPTPNIDNLAREGIICSVSNPNATARGFRTKQGFL